MPLMKTHFPYNFYRSSLVTIDIFGLFLPDFKFKTIADFVIIQREWDREGERKCNTFFSGQTGLIMFSFTHTLPLPISVVNWLIWKYVKCRGIHERNGNNVRIVTMIDTHNHTSIPKIFFEYFFFSVARSFYSLRENLLIFIRFKVCIVKCCEPHDILSYTLYYIHMYKYFALGMLCSF